MASATKLTSCFRKRQGAPGSVMGIDPTPFINGEIMKKQNLLSLAIGSTFAAAALTSAAHAAENPFSATKLEAGYQLAQAEVKQKDGKCGEAKCGADKKATEMKDAAKTKEGKCGEAKCGADKKAAEAKAAGKMKDGKCGEAKCGANK